MNFLDLFPKYDIAVIMGIILINYKSHNLRFMVNMEKEKELHPIASKQHFLHELFC